MGAVADWLNESLQNKEVDIIVEDTLARLKQRDKIIDRFLPIKEYDSRNFLAYVVRKINTLASVIAYGGEIPSTRQGKLSKVSAQMLKIALARTYDEETQWQIIEAMDMAGAKGVTVQDRMTPEGSIIKGANDSLAQFLFGGVESLSQAVMDTLDVMAWQCLQFGKVDFYDARLNTTTVIDWKDAEADYNHFPNALVATGNTADTSLNLWTDYEYADPLQTLVNAQETYHDTNGFQPTAIILSRRLRNDILQCNSTKEAARAMQSAPYLGAVAPNVLNILLEARELPPIITFDEMYEIENGEGDVTKGRFFNDNRFAFLSEDMGLRAIGVTLESRGSFDEMPISGLHVETYEKKKTPVIDETIAVCTAVPIIMNPKLLYSQQVKV